MKRIMLFVALLILLFNIFGCASYHKTTKEERIYLIRVALIDDKAQFPKSSLPFVKEKVIGFINDYSNMKLQIFSDSLISTQNLSGKSEYQKKAKRNFGYVITILPLDDKIFEIKVNCYTTDKIKTKREHEEYNNIVFLNSKILIYYLCTNNIIPKFMNNPKKYDTIGDDESILD